MVSYFSGHPLSKLALAVRYAGYASLASMQHVSVAGTNQALPTTNESPEPDKGGLLAAA